VEANAMTDTNIHYKIAVAATTAALICDLTALVVGIWWLIGTGICALVAAVAFIRAMWLEVHDD
jgi:predicted outer membrane lipoprotein